MCSVYVDEPETHSRAEQQGMSSVSVLSCIASCDNIVPQCRIVGKFAKDFDLANQYPSNTVQTHMHLQKILCTFVKRTDECC